ncbi:1-deoxy-D-xylulose-5-phosphate synthase [Micromonospora endophytica]|uniref:1-deoxy-D-xylulose-5-phosphate synthase n=1 Tax=Micromonospora endophytica TaxID=515350 RepID=A0A2W2CPR2_9ACTN|nr:1-deoxy-D-xylulose-5-phosphate synthase [Micromonospora endophytica]PZG00543.1 1-deoxy-D-xylulose-5-phosphate synthase [Micromonospora endophytica]RIW45810.1 1-deoxy-D-xylulose-5-phosphate synthase [Micromonospora endophytica]BCJ61942.1 1-deoxy-D-xylulose-5-phosphate synthase 1 [Micromonospora endophytica]
MRQLEEISGPGDLRDLTLAEAEQLAGAIRRFLVEKVGRTGGHLGPNLGVVELTLALHRVFDSPRDRLLWDTGHQSYVHKILTGRAAAFDTLRQPGGLSGYPSRAESEHDLIENSHASTALSYADGLAKAYELRGVTDRAVVAVIGDGALTGGMAWEALNNIAAARHRPLVIVVNDNERSYAPTIGGLAVHLAALRTAPGYERLLERVQTQLPNIPVVGSPLYEVLHGVKKGLKDVLAPQGMFEDLGLKYVGPVDGHDLAALEAALASAKRFDGPVLVHCITEKGRGHLPAEQDELDRHHVVRPSSAGAGQPAAAKAYPSWTSVFGAELVSLAATRPDIVAVTAAMLEPTGLSEFARRYPERTFDVGIAEQHAMTSAAGLALGGLHPVVAVYATFLNRGFDQLLMDVALHRAPVTIALDRAGVTGDDGPSHNGMWDLSLLQLVPGVRVNAPRDAASLRRALAEAVAVDDGPTVIRYPKGATGPDIAAVDTDDGLDVLFRSGRADVLMVAVGPMAPICLEAAGRLVDDGYGVTVVDPRWVLPVPRRLLELAREHRLVATVEDNGCAGGVGSAVRHGLDQQGCYLPTRLFGLPQRFLDQGKRATLLADHGLNARHIAGTIAEDLLALRHDGAQDTVADGRLRAEQLAH